MVARLLDITVHIEAAGELTAAFTTHLPALGQQLASDRIFLYLRSPADSLGQVPFCWRHSPDVPLVYDEDWQAEPGSLSQEDPMFAAALRGDPSLFIEDVERADSDTLNREFERENFGHRALVHAHIYRDGQLWGVLQPCQFGQPRRWSQADRDCIHHAVEMITPYVIAYVRNSVPVMV